VPLLLRQVLVPEPARSRSAFALIGWWEARRPLYNVVVGTVGLGSWAVVAFARLLDPRLPVRVRALDVLAYGVLANLCYCLGPAVELWLRRTLRADHAVVGPALFRHGLVFAVGLTLLPMPLTLLVMLVRLLRLPVLGIPLP
jgi:hypothetical protein